MTNLQYKEKHTYSPWNPFLPTKRDIERTNKLAEKNCAVAGIFAYLLPIVTMIYLNRGANTLKILGYAFATIVALVIAFPELEDDSYDVIGEIVGFAAAIAIVVENVNSINQARARLEAAKEQNSLDV